MILSNTNMSLGGKTDYEKDLLQKLADLPLDIMIPIYDRETGQQIDCLSTVFIDKDHICGSSLDAGEEKTYEITKILTIIP